MKSFVKYILSFAGLGLGYLSILGIKYLRDNVIRPVLAIRNEGNEIIKEHNKFMNNANNIKLIDNETEFRITYDSEYTIINIKRFCEYTFVIIRINNGNYKTIYFKNNVAVGISTINPIIINNNRYYVSTNINMCQYTNMEIILGYSGVMITHSSIFDDFDIDISDMPDDIIIKPLQKNNESIINEYKKNYKLYDKTIRQNSINLVYKDILNLYKHKKIIIPITKDNNTEKIMNLLKDKKINITEDTIITNNKEYITLSKNKGFIVCSFEDILSNIQYGYKLHDDDWLYIFIKDSVNKILKISPDGSESYISTEPEYNDIECLYSSETEIVGLTKDGIKIKFGKFEKYKDAEYNKVVYL